MLLLASTLRPRCCELPRTWSRTPTSLSLLGNHKTGGHMLADFLDSSMSGPSRDFYFRLPHSTGQGVTPGQDRLDFQYPGGSLKLAHCASPIRLRAGTRLSSRKVSNGRSGLRGGCYTRGPVVPCSILEQPTSDPDQQQTKTTHLCKIATPLSP